MRRTRRVKTREDKSNRGIMKTEKKIEAERVGTGEVLVACIQHKEVPEGKGSKRITSFISVKDDRVSSLEGRISLPRTAAAS